MAIAYIILLVSFKKSAAIHKTHKNRRPTLCGGAKFNPGGITCGSAVDPDFSYTCKPEPLIYYDVPHHSKHPRLSIILSLCISDIQTTG